MEVDSVEFSTEKVSFIQALAIEEIPKAAVLPSKNPNHFKIFSKFVRKSGILFIDAKMDNCLIEANLKLKTHPPKEKIFKPWMKGIYLFFQKNLKGGAFEPCLMYYNPFDKCFDCVRIFESETTRKFGVENGKIFHFPKGISVSEDKKEVTLFGGKPFSVMVGRLDLENVTLYWEKFVNVDALAENLKMF